MLSDELKYANAIFGFCTPTDFWPQPLANLNYQILGVEREVRTIANGEVRTVVPEIICGSSTANHVFCLEVKSASLRQRQAESYQAITPQQIVAQGLLPAGFVAGRLLNDVFFVTLQVNVQRLVQLMDNGGIYLPLVADDGTQFKLVRGLFNLNAMQQAFDPGVTILPTHQWPKLFVRFNSKAPVSDLAAPIMTSAAGFLLRGQPFSAEDVATKGISHWQWCGTQERNTFLNRIHDFLDRAQQEELKPYYQPSTPPHRVRPPRNIVWRPRFRGAMNAKRRMSFMRDVTEFVKRQQAGTPFVPQQHRLI